MHHSRWTSCTAIAAVVSQLAACGGVSELTKANVDRAETAVRQAQQTIAGSESGALELQRGEDNLVSAKNFVAEGSEKMAAHHAKQAQLDAELAVARAQSAVARKAADEVQSSNKMLREEAQRRVTERQ